VLVALLASVISIPVDADDVADSADLLVGGSRTRIGQQRLPPDLRGAQDQVVVPARATSDLLAGSDVEIRIWSTSSG
jgi:hypothetical protein